jgi:isoleucyl-tRNA synthetase
VFKPVPTRVDYVKLEHDVQRFWDENETSDKYMARNQKSDEHWSFIDGPITANNPMGVHHAWGRSYKDLYNRFWTMRGRKLRYQNGFDCQGLWIEVEVEKELGFKNKKDIEVFGVAEFVEACKERVQRFAKIMTDQSIRLGYWMDWDNSYYTNSDENNYAIWGFLKKCWEKGWIYKGHDTMPWCPRCGTGISQHEIVTEGYQEITHASVYLKFPITGRADGQQEAGSRSGARPHPNPLPEVEGTGFGSSSSPIRDGEGTGLDHGPRPGESLLVWTTTPWTLAANVAAAVHPDLVYEKVRQGDEVFYVSKGARATAVRGEHEVIGEVKGSELVGLTYRGPFDELPVQHGIVHRVIEWEEVSDEEGTGIVHIAPGAGAEDFALSKVHNLPVIAPLQEDGTYTVGGGFGFLEGKFAGDVPQLVFESLSEKGLLYRVEDYTHRYPTCWRCGTELVFRLVDEWFIAMDELRPKMMDVTRKVRWIPEFGMARELDWLKNMHDWMISKKRYYGLALPIYECQACHHFEVIGSETELEVRAVEGWDQFEGHSPHRPWVDEVKIACSNCGGVAERIKDVGNPWLDAGIVPFSTLEYRHAPEYWKEWFPADWVSESFPGQFRNWFYALIAMGTVMVLDTEYEGTPPFLSLFSYALMRDEKGEEMHKSKGNAIWFDDAAEQIGVDVMRWLFLRTNPANNLNFGYGPGEELKRGFLSTLWNTYSFFVTYANLDNWTPGSWQTGKQADGQDGGQSGNLASGQSGKEANEQRGSVSPVHPEALEGGAENDELAFSELDRWALSELNQLVATCTHSLENYDSMTACREIEDFVEGLSNWYVRRSRRRFWKSESDADKHAAYTTLWTCLMTLSRLMAPHVPFLAEEIYQNLVRTALPIAPESVHLTDWPAADDALIDEELSGSVRLVQRLTSLGRSARAKANIKVRQPLEAVHVKLQSAREAETIRRLADQLLDELNVKRLEVIENEAEFLDYQVRPNLPVLGPKYGGEVGRIQRALATADKAAVARSVSTGRSVALDGFELQPDELLVTTAGKPGYALAEEAGYAVAVTTEVTPDLADEGLARELVRHVQELRRSAGFDIADHVRFRYEGDDDLDRVINKWRDYIGQETLADVVERGRGSGFSEEQDIDGRKVRLEVERV